MDTLQKSKWYQKKWLLILLLFILPPLGILGILKKDTKTWKKVLYTLLGVFMSFYLLGVVLMIFAPNFDFLNGNALYDEGKYGEAISEYKKVKQDDENYTDALQKIKLAQSKFDSISLVKKQIVLQRQKDSIVEIEKQNKKLETLRLFQKQWADSTLKSESKPGNRHFVSVKYSLPDTILFEYTERVTKKGFNSNFNVDTRHYPEHYKKTLSKKLGKGFIEYPVYISFIPNQKVVSKNNPASWKRPVILNKGLKIYSGNQYNKKYLGILKCKYKDPNRSFFDGNQFVIVQKSNGNLVQILRYELNKHYWIKANDPNKNSGRGLFECY